MRALCWRRNDAVTRYPSVPDRSGPLQRLARPVRRQPGRRARRGGAATSKGPSADSSRAQQLADALGFYLAGMPVAGNPGAAGEVPVMLFPDWETLPYDLFSPHQDIVSDRIRVLNWLHGAGTGVLVVPCLLYTSPSPRD